MRIFCLSSRIMNDDILIKDSPNNVNGLKVRLLGCYWHLKKGNKMLCVGLNLLKHGDTKTPFLWWYSHELPAESFPNGFNDSSKALFSIYRLWINFERLYILYTGLNIHAHHAITVKWLGNSCVPSLGQPSFSPYGCNQVSWDVEKMCHRTPQDKWRSNAIR